MLPVELWNKVVLEYSPNVNQTLGTLSVTCKALRDTFEDESIWLSLFRKRCRNMNYLPAMLGGGQGGNRHPLVSWRERYLALHDLERRFRCGEWDRRIRLSESEAIRDIFIMRHQSSPRICVALGNGEIVLLEGENIVQRKMGPSPAVRCFVDEKGTIYSGLQNGSITVGDLELTKAHQSRVTSVGRIYPFGEESSTNTGMSSSIMYSCSPGDGVVKLWDLSASNMSTSVDGSDNLMSFRHPGVHSVAVSPTNPNILFSGGTDRMVNLWDSRVGGRSSGRGITTWENYENRSGRVNTPVHSVKLDDWVLSLEGSEENFFIVRAADKAVNTLDLRLVSSQQTEANTPTIENPIGLNANLVPRNIDQDQADRNDANANNGNEGNGINNTPQTDLFLSDKGDCRISREHEHKKLITQFHCEMRKTVTARLVSCSLDGMVKISSKDPYNGTYFKEDDNYETQEERALASILENFSTITCNNANTTSRSQRSIHTNSYSAGDSASSTSNAGCSSSSGNVNGANQNGGPSSSTSNHRREGGLTSGVESSDFANDSDAPGGENVPNALKKLLNSTLKKRERSSSRKLRVSKNGTTLTCSNDYVLCVDFDDTRLIVGGVNGSLDVYDFENSAAKRRKNSKGVAAGPATSGSNTPVRKNSKFAFCKTRNQACNKRSTSSSADSTNDSKYTLENDGNDNGSKDSIASPNSQKSPSPKRSRKQAWRERDISPDGKAVDADRISSATSTTAASSSLSTAASSARTSVNSLSRVNTTVLSEDESSSDEENDTKRLEMYRVADSHHRSSYCKKYGLLSENSEGAYDTM